MKGSHPVNAKKPFEKRRCAECCATLRQNQRINKVNPQAKKKWDELKADQKKAHFRREKRCMIALKPDLGPVARTNNEQIAKNFNKDEID